MQKYLDIPPHEQDVVDNFDFELARVDADYTDERECEKRHNRFPDLIPNIEPLLEATNLWYIREFIEAKLGFMNSKYLVNKGHIRSLLISEDMKEHNHQKFSRNTKLPDNFGNLSELQTIKINYTNLETLPKSIGNLKKLFHLNLEFNNIISLPESIGDLSNLRKLWLFGNQLVSLPDSIGNLSKLSEIQLNDNKISRVPESFKKLKCYSIELIDNPLVSLSNININKLEDYSFTVNNLTQKGKDLLRPIDYDGSASDSVDIDNHKRIIRNLNPLVHYYEKSPIVLAKQYCHNPKSLTNDEIERLIWEASPSDREFLESQLLIDNEIIKKINDRLSIPLKNGLKIIK